MRDATNASPHSTAYAECARIVQEGSSDRAVSIGFAPEQHRNALWALYAFALETARVPDQVSQPLPGEIRLQWWRDRLQADDAEPDVAGQGSLVAVALIDTVRRYELPFDALDRYLEARVFDLYSDPMGERAAFEAYAGETASTIVMLAAMILDRAAAPQAAHAAGHAGVAETAASAIRNADRHRARHQVYVPSDILAATGTAPEIWLGGGASAEAAVQAFTAYANEHLRKAESGFAALPASLRPAFLPALYRARQLTASQETVWTPLRRLWSYWRDMRR
ncbi:phytoene/squalene synthase family protein [Aureimonas sp. ME7]|uniref:phytoene/squalene synthase family protein n=1 Tax=Aureimonas sp. ME7 TaxID=2744252 RepID=UPI0015F57520|nr:phytoene/squalene synthase family protein [Aureimonas sp. ME7]